MDKSTGGKAFSGGDPRCAARPTCYAPAFLP